MEDFIAETSLIEESAFACGSSDAAATAGGSFAAARGLLDGELNKSDAASTYTETMTYLTITQNGVVLPTASN